MDIPLGQWVTSCPSTGLVVGMTKMGAAGWNRGRAGGLKQMVEDLNLQIGENEKHYTTLNCTEWNYTVLHSTTLHYMCQNWDRRFRRNKKGYIEQRKRSVRVKHVIQNRKQ